MNWSAITFFASIPMFIAAFYCGARFYPPGWSYDEEKRNNRISATLTVLASISAVSSFFLPR